MARKSTGFSDNVQVNRDARLEDILVGATRLFNRQGFSATTMEQVAEEVQLVPGALYHYVKNKPELAYLCFRRGCDMRAEQLENVVEPGIDGLEQLRRFFRGLLREEQSRMILFNEVHSLPAKKAQDIQQRQAANKERIQALLVTGMEDGSVVRSDPELTARALAATVDFISMWFSARDQGSYRFVAESIDDILTYGTWSRQLAAPEFPGEGVFTLPEIPGIELSEDPRREQILITALQLFNKFGYAGTSINQVAKHLGVTRGGVYHYFNDKEELLQECLFRAHKINELARSLDTPREYCYWEIQSKRYMFYMHDTAAGPLVTYPTVLSLGEEKRRPITVQTDEINRSAHRRISDAIEAGQARPVDPLVALQLRFGTFATYPVWFDREEGYSPLEIADNHTRLTLLGLKPREA